MCHDSSIEDSPWSYVTHGLNIFLGYTHISLSVCCVGFSVPLIFVLLLIYCELACAILLYRKFWWYTYNDYGFWVLLSMCFLMLKLATALGSSAFWLIYRSSACTIHLSVFSMGLFLMSVIMNTPDCNKCFGCRVFMEN